MKERDWAALFGSEWERIKRHGSAIVDADDKKVFWDVIREAKKSDRHWTFESIQPTKRSATERARDECIAHIKSLRKPKVEEEALPELPRNFSK